MLAGVCACAQGIGVRRGRACAVACTHVPRARMCRVHAALLAPISAPCCILLLLTAAPHLCICTLRGVSPGLVSNGAMTLGSRCAMCAASSPAPASARACGCASTPHPSTWLAATACALRPTLAHAHAHAPTSSWSWASWSPRPWSAALARAPNRAASWQGRVVHGAGNARVRVGAHASSRASSNNTRRCPCQQRATHPWAWAGTPLP